jgi:hypothetical protein
MGERRSSSPVSAFDEVTDALYGLPPGEFTAARNRAAEEAKGGGDRPLAERVRALRRPTAAAYALNLLVRGHPDLVEQLLELGKGLRDAQAQLQGTRLRELAAQRTALVRAVAEQARREAAASGQPVGNQAADELEQTLRAVLADEEAADEFAAGRLTHALTPGSTLPDLPAGAAPRAPARAPADAPTTPGTSRAEAEAEAERKRADDEGRRRLADAERELRRLETERHAADAALDRVRTQAERAADQRSASRERLQRAEQALDQAREALEAAERKAAASREEVTAAEERARTARARLEEQQGTVDRLRGSRSGRHRPGRGR